MSQLAAHSQQDSAFQSKCCPLLFWPPEKKITPKMILLLPVVDAYPSERWPLSLAMLHSGTIALKARHAADCILEMTSLSCCLKITSVHQHPTNHLLQPPHPGAHYFGLSSSYFYFNLALNCWAWIGPWTAWGRQAGRRCVRMHESLCYHHLFSFSSPSGAVRSQTRYHSP